MNWSVTRPRMFRRRGLHHDTVIKTDNQRRSWKRLRLLNPRVPDLQCLECGITGLQKPANAGPPTDESGKGATAAHGCEQASSGNSRQRPSIAFGEINIDLTNCQSTK